MSVSAPGPDGVSTGLTLASKIDRLFATVHPKDRGEFTYREVEAGVREIVVERGESDGGLSASYICQLRRGRRANPTLRQVELLAAFFKVPVTYFVGSPEDVEAIDAQMSLVRVLRDHDVRDLALRASSLTPDGIRTVIDLVTSLQKVPGMTRGRARPRDDETPDGEAAW